MRLSQLQSLLEKAQSMETTSLIEGNSPKNHKAMSISEGEAIFRTHTMSNGPYGGVHKKSFYMDEQKNVEFGIQRAGTRKEARLKVQNGPLGLTVSAPEGSSFAERALTKPFLGPQMKELARDLKFTVHEIERNHTPEVEQVSEVEKDKPEISSMDAAADNDLSQENRPDVGFSH